MANKYYVGLMSGTSMDAVDAALVNFKNDTPQLVASYSVPLPEEIKQALLALTEPSENEINRYGEMDVVMGLLFAEATQQLLQKADVSTTEVVAIGSHGQTIRHHPDFQYPFTMQIGDPNVIAEKTGITTVADFRRRDMACGGQGAPFAPAFHNAVFRKAQQNRSVINLGGIANVTLLSGDIYEPVLGFDTGPGNILIDAWIRAQKKLDYDKDGAWAASGKLNEKLLQRLLADDYLLAPPPKTTGREYFNLPWLKNYLTEELPPEDIQHTLTAFTALSALQALEQYGFEDGQIILCGGGVYNKLLVEYFEKYRGPYSVHFSGEFGVDPKWLEAIAFAWLAKQTLSGKPGNIPSVTGAKRSVILGGIYPGK
jgi:anhydro-N-acetylmuramic acid kinase